MDRTPYCFDCLRGVLRPFTECRGLRRGSFKEHLVGIGVEAVEPHENCVAQNGVREVADLLVLESQGGGAKPFH